MLHFNYKHPRTRLDRIALGKRARLPADAHIGASCTPVKDCPKLTLKSVRPAHLKRLFHELEGKRFRKGAHLQLLVSAPHRRAERIVLTILQFRNPVGHRYVGIRKTTTKKKTATTKRKTVKKGQR